MLFRGDGEESFYVAEGEKVRVLYLKAVSHIVGPVAHDSCCNAQAESQTQINKGVAIIYVSYEASRIECVGDIAVRSFIVVID